MQLSFSQPTSRNKNVPRRNSPASEWSGMKSQNIFSRLGLQATFSIKSECPFWYSFTVVPPTLRKLCPEQQTLGSLLDGWAGPAKANPFH